ncbi:hypothetical protein BDV19DRAFT_390049 [Aspergillus venezuelensis]
MGITQSSNRFPQEHPPDRNTGFQAYYDGDRHRASGLHSWIRLWRPQKLDSAQVEARLAELALDSADNKGWWEKRSYIDPSMNREHEKNADLETYYSITKGIPRRLIVQATKTVMDTAKAGLDPLVCHWSRTDLNGDVPWAIWLTELCLNPIRLPRDKGGGQKHGATKQEGEQGREIVSQEASHGDTASMLFLKCLSWVLSIILTLSLGWVIQILIAVAIIAAPWTDGDTSEPYARYDNVHWHWPKHAINPLDQSPDNPSRPSKEFKSILPNRLVVRRRDEQGDTVWEVKTTDALRRDKAGMLMPYVFLSFARRHYPDGDLIRTDFFRHVANKILDDENASRRSGKEEINAFWVDFDCVTQTPGKRMTEEVHTICNAVRCAKRVYIMLPDDSDENKEIWGSRLWTLPEVLLAAEKIRYCITHPMDTDKPDIRRVSLTDMSERFWALEADSEEGASKPHHERAIGHLVDHYTNRVNLSELQILAFVIQALAGLSTGPNIGHRTPDLAYAAMGLMSYRLEPNGDDNVFQAVARLCLVNDSDQLLERLLCLSPTPTQQLPSGPLRKGEGPVANGIELLLNIADQDQYGCHLWDIHPTCNVVGIGNDKIAPTLIVDRCKGIPIRWKSFPRLKYTKALVGFRVTLSQLVLYVGAWFLLYSLQALSTISVLGFSTLAGDSNNSTTTITIDSNDNTSQGLSSQHVQISFLAAAIYFGIGWIISWFTPVAVRQLCSGGSDVVTSHLVGIEGTLPLDELEQVIFGATCYGQLSYEPSTTPFSAALHNHELHTGKEPPEFEKHWDTQRRRLNIPSTHRLFTIVDTGNLSVSIIAAERPPVVALVCGHEGGMLRTLLCSWRFDTNTLFRESVMRMRSSLSELARPNDWLKISLASQGDVGRMRMAMGMAPSAVANDGSETTLAIPTGPGIRASERR